MVQRIGMLMVAVGVALFVSMPAVAQDAGKMQGKKVEKTMEMKKSQMTEAAPLKEISCTKECGFTVRSRDEAEVLAAAKAHIAKHHPQMKLTDKQIKEMVKEVK